MKVLKMVEPLTSRFADRQPKTNSVTKTAFIINSPVSLAKGRSTTKKIFKGLGWLLILPLYIPYYVSAKGTDMLLCAEEHEGGYPTIIRMTIAIMAFCWLVTWMNPWLAMITMTLLMFFRLYFNKAKETDTMF